MKLPIPKIDIRWWGILLGCCSLSLRLLFGWSPWLCEVFYARGVFLLVRLVVDYTLAWLPFATVYLLFIALLLLLLRSLYRAARHVVLKIRGNAALSWWQLLAGACLSLGGFLGWGITAFFWLWGFNYARIPLATQMQLDLQPLSRDALLHEAQWIMAQCPPARAQIPRADTFPLPPAALPPNLETEMRRLLVHVLDSLGYPTWGRVRGRYLYPKGTLYRFAASGIYMPFTGEGHIDAALEPAQQPFTLAHELAHGYGFGDEAECNFLGFLACMASDHPAIRYSGYLTYWRYVFSELRRIDRDCYRELRPAVPTGMANDLTAIYAVADRYPEFFPHVQQTAYHFYLQSQGVQEGIKSYDKMLLFVYAWRK